MASGNARKSNVGASIISLKSSDTVQHQNEPSSSEQSRVVYIGHLPHGFYEKQLLGFFSQFGKLTRVRLSRSKKSGRAKHYAFLEFQYPEVAQVAAEAMNGYFLFSQKLDVKLMPVDKIHPELFKGANRRFKNVPWSKLERRRHDKELTPAELARRVSRAIKKDKERQKKILEAGIEYEYPSLGSLKPVKSKKMVFSDDE
ncbi:hypothetical protein CEUSTIGMA_g11071.t1 [Chlamydomonas eustigma]|uniref:RRM domain-containing protein n=1 Tax=Chlamydomonas eustigma TaxID=1157962 RepID=A0A250XKQ7_9CHLO|nr:hypothetical protein CEUSTIGMA_g11071.t1 [Chlamydomonas eustigma]|eukprot:GAX83647.1 hypothetical protein CEUSTIGMA_g11071.t1 [Chlamydomonas eustigma]